MSVFRQLLGLRILIPFLLYLAWLAAGIWLFADVGLWNPGLLKPTVAWALFSGVGLFFSINKALRQETFWREALAATVGATVLVEFYINLVSFPLLVELVLQPILILTALISAVVATRPGGDSVEKASNWILTIVGLAAFAWVLWSLIERWNEIQGSQLLLEVLVPVWLAPIALSFVYALALYAGYEQAFKRISWKGGESSWRAKLAYASLVGVQISKLRRFDGAVQLAGAHESTFRGARSAMTAEVQRRREMLEPKMAPPPGDVNQVEWSIDITEGRVTLKGDLPNGYPTETWINGQLLEREPDGVFAWDVAAGLPTPVSLINERTDCWHVQRQIDMWDRLTADASTRAGVVRNQAYARAARDHASALGCWFA
ncbi:MAG: hypothetical protein WB239_11380 [Acidimicrobiia bacterium]